MKAIMAAAVLLAATAAQCFGAGDPVSSVKKGDREETTTVKRDGKTILRITLYRPSEPENRRMLRQEVLGNDKVVMAISEFQGKRSFNIFEKAGVTVTIGQDSSQTFATPLPYRRRPHRHG